MEITFIPEHLKHPASVTRWPPNVPRVDSGLIFFSEYFRVEFFSSEMPGLGPGKMPISTLKGLIFHGFDFSRFLGLET